MLFVWLVLLVVLVLFALWEAVAVLCVLAGVMRRLLT
jgi:hypothetical protein